MSQKSKALPRAGTVQGIVLILPITLATMGVVLLAPILPRMAAHFAAVPSAKLLVQLILVVPALCLALFSAPAGWLADRLGRRRILLIAMVLYSVAGVAPVFLDSLYGILASRVAVGLTEAVIMVCSTTLIGDYFHGADRDKWLAYQTGIASLAAVGLFAESGALGAAFGWRGPFWMYASSLLLCAVLAAFTWEPVADSQSRSDAEPADLGVFPWRVLIGICGITVLAAMGFFIGQIELAGALGEQHVTDTARIGAMSGAVSLAVPVGSVLFRFVVYHLRLGVQLLLSFLLMGLGLIVAGTAGSVAMLLAGVAVNLLGGGLALPTMLTWVMRQLSFGQRGRGTGLWMASFEIGQFSAAMAATALVALLGGLHAAFAVVGGVLTLVGLIAAATLIRPAPVGQVARRSSIR